MTDQEFETNDDGEILDENGDVVFCEAGTCEAPATQRVVVSEESAHDATRDFCEQCYEIYMIGVQHGRYHEATLYGAKPGRDSSQDLPPTTHHMALKLALAILKPFSESGNLYDDYKADEVFTDEEYDEMIAVLAVLVGGEAEVKRE
jgi:hypothetical protein